ncbi:MAG: N-acetylmuramoyl-L-alanine amidase [Verrucomicrobiales bacterium]|jgi:N-acetylmuramoyl-L-alanine amidase
MKTIFQNALSALGAIGFLVCVGMLLTRPTNFASYLPDLVEVIEQKIEEPIVRIVLDPGHGGIDGGSHNLTLQEKNLALTTARLVKSRINAAQLENVEVVLTRDEDLYLSLHQRVAVANRFSKCYFVSIHYNASVHRSASGTETFFASPKPSIIQSQVRKRLRLDPDTPIRDNRGEKFAASVQESLVLKLGSRDRGVRNNPKLVLPREAIGPAILVECVFLSNRDEAFKLHRNSYIEEIADGITEGILNYVRDTDQDPFANVTPLSLPEPTPDGA